MTAKFSFSCAIALGSLLVSEAGHATQAAQEAAQSTTTAGNAAKATASAPSAKIAKTAGSTTAEPKTAPGAAAPTKDAAAPTKDAAAPIKDTAKSTPSETAQDAPAQAAEAAPQNPHGAAPHGMPGGGPPQNLSMPDPSVPSGSVIVEVVDEESRPVRGAKVNLLSLFQSVAEGNTEDVTTKMTDENGSVRFDKLDDAIRFSYAVAVEDRGASYDVPSFRLGKVGQRVRVHTFASTTDPREAFVGIQGYFTVQVNDDLLRIDGAYRVFNMGQKTWIPSGIFLHLPEDAEAVDAKLTAGDAGFEEAPKGLKLVGSFPPGQKDLAFSFHVPNTNTETRTIAFSIPPHTVDLNVLIEQAPGMGLSVSPGFAPAESRVGRNEKKVLVTRRVLRPGDGQLSEIRIELSGLPVIGPGRWIATFVALFIALLGILATWMKRRESEAEKQEQRKKAQDTLVGEMLLLETAHQNGDIGPRTYEETRREILVALARLEPDAATT